MSLNFVRFQESLNQAFAENFTCLSHGKVKFVFSKKATKIDEIFTVDLTLTSWDQVEQAL